MEKQYKKLSIDFPVDEFIRMKIVCAKKDVSLKELVTQSILRTVEDFEDEWLFKDSLEDNDGPNHVLIDHDGSFHAV